jgi:hypothetical protein
MGLLYPLHSRRPLLRSYPINPTGQPTDPSSLPVIPHQILFPDHVNLGNSPLEFHTCVVTYGEHRFLIHSYYHEDSHKNEALSIIRPSVVWRGEVVIFSMGSRVPYLSRAAATRRVHNLVVSKYVEYILWFILMLTLPCPSDIFPRSLKPMTKGESLL